MTYHPTDADERLAEMERRRTRRTLAALPLTEQAAWLRSAGRVISESMKRSRERLAARQRARGDES